jgi:LacI family transcriptional regulator
MATIFDVAREAGVSTGTVSRALNHRPEVDPATRTRVEEVAARLGYRADPLARGMVTRATATVGLIVPDVASPFFHELARGVEDVASAHGQLVVLCNSDRRLDKELQYLAALRAHRVGGLILAGAPHEAPPDGELKEKGPPAVLVIRRGPPGARWPAVLLDYAAAVRQQVAHVLALGHRRVGYVNGPPAHDNAAARLAGYREALADAGVGFDAQLVAEADFTIEGGYAAARHLLGLEGSDGPPTALALANDYMALGAMQAVRARGLEVPGDVSVVGFDDFVVARLVEPRLTTVRVPMREMGARAMRLLLGEMERRRDRVSGDADDVGGDREEFVPTELVVRESAAPR